MDAWARRAASSALLVFLVFFWLAAGPTRASLEEFDTWNLGAEEADDEYGMDFFFSSFTPEWERAWRGARDGARTSLGCVTRERWEVLTQARLERELGPRARFRYGFVQEERLVLANQQHSFGFEIEAAGAWLGAFARPEAAKERHDFGLTLRREWAGVYELGLALTEEDLLNDFWTGRSFVVERERVDFLERAVEWRWHAARRWSADREIALEVSHLPEFRRRLTPAPSSGEPEVLRSLGGSAVALRGALDPRPRVRIDFVVARKAARLAEAPADTSGATDFRRSAWAAVAHLSHALRGPLQALWSIQLRRNRERDDAGAGEPYRLAVDEVVGRIGARWPIRTWVAAEAGYALERATVEQSGPADELRFTHGTRGEDRLYLAGEFSVRGVRVRLVETLELDGESYDVVGVHDKGFIQIQAAF